MQHTIHCIWLFELSWELLELRLFIHPNMMKLMTCAVNFTFQSIRFISFVSIAKEICKGKSPHYYYQLTLDLKKLNFATHCSENLKHTHYSFVIAYNFLFCFYINCIYFDAMPIFFMLFDQIKLHAPIAPLSCYSTMKYKNISNNF